MNGWLETVGLGVATFAATNADNLFLLMLWFSRANNDPHREREIIVGQYLGLTVLVLVSLLGYVGTFLIPGNYAGLLGCFPILLGLRELLRLGKEDEAQEAGALSSGTPRAVGFVRLRWLSAQALSVAAITIANGSDNIAVYVPLFAASSTIQVAISIVVFAVLAWVWCRVADWLAENPITAGPLRRYGRLLMPVVLIGIGVTILLESGALTPLFH